MLSVKPEHEEFAGECEAQLWTGEGPALEKQGEVSLGPGTAETGRLAVEELARRILQLEALVFKQDT